MEEHHLNNSLNQDQLQNIKKIKSIMEMYLEFGASTPSQTIESRIYELLNLTDQTFPSIVAQMRNSDMDILEITIQRLQHRFGNQEAGCIDVDNAQSLNRMLPEAIEILDEIIEELEE